MMVAKPAPPMATIGLPPCPVMVAVPATAPLVVAGAVRDRRRAADLAVDVGRTAADGVGALAIEQVLAGERDACWPNRPGL